VGPRAQALGLCGDGRDLQRWLAAVAAGEWLRAQCCAAGLRSGHAGRLGLGSPPVVLSGRGLPRWCVAFNAEADRLSERGGQLLPVAEWQQRRRRGLFRIEVKGAAVEVQYAVHLIQLAAVFQQAVTQPTGLQILAAPLKANPATGIDGARGGFVFQAVGKQATSGQQHPDVARRDEAIGQQVEALLVGRQVDLERRALGRGRRDQLASPILGPAFGRRSRCRSRSNNSR